MLEIIENTDAQLETDKYASMSILQKYPKPEPVYYKNHHVGECKGKKHKGKLQADINDCYGSRLNIWYIFN
jgi:hypothetical protein